MCKHNNYIYKSHEWDYDPKDKDIHNLIYEITLTCFDCGHELKRIATDEEIKAINILQLQQEGQYERYGLTELNCRLS